MTPPAALAARLRQMAGEATPLKRGWLDFGGCNPSLHGQTPLEARVAGEPGEPVWAWTRLNKHDTALLIALRNNLPTIIACLSALDRAEKALDHLAVVQRVRVAYQGGTIPVGYRCKLCDEECDLGQSLTHKASCALATLRAAKEAGT
jgi:hypothetical protein